MAETEMLMVFSYDVSENRNRRRVAKVLESACVRVQKSVFEAVMTDNAAKTLADAAARHLGQGDSLRVYAIGAHGRDRCQSWGPCPLPEQQDFYLL